ncbi:MAG TPA: SGNH/GDSL hydrolase family protein [Candidatus Saccharimonadales bacterium]|nr:SGNH/GDSL hydrolase family protein [Candidatus Saccharimonadales bacterium]
MVASSAKHVVKFIFLSMITLTGVVAIITTYQTAASAASVSWFSDAEPTLEKMADPLLTEDAPACTPRIVAVDKRPHYNYLDPSDSTNICVYDRGSWRYGLSNRPYRQSNSMIGRDTSFVVGLGYDQKMYRINNLNARYAPDFVPHSKSLVYSMGNSSSFWGQNLVVYKDFPSRLVKNTDGQSYDMKDRHLPDYEFKRPNGYVLPVGAVASSSNGKWLIFEAVDLGIMRLNLETYDIKRISTISPRYDLGLPPFMSLSINNKGDYVVVGGQNTPFMVYNITDSCGDTTVTDQMTLNVPVARPCLERDLGAYMRTKFPRFSAADNIKLSADNGSISFRLEENLGFNNMRYTWYRLKVSDYISTPSLDYLALGDSYSSGEGDTLINPTTLAKYYLLGTDAEGNNQIPTEKCHISSRSYPFLLQSTMGISDDKMQSVACSGAMAKDDYQVTAGYEGQIEDKKARLGELSDDDLQRYQQVALNDFIPGRIQQLKFVEKYQPKAITLTAGGNDVGFGSIIQNCVVTLFTSCSYAKSDAGKTMVGQAIRSQYSEYVELYEKIREISPNTKVYAVGYPKFVGNDALLCALNVQLDTAERTMINEAVTYLNQIIKSAADRTGVKYVNIEDSLTGHRLCEQGDAYVTGIAFRGSSERQESFHPNHDGHRLMQKAIIGALGSQSLLDFEHTLQPTPGPYSSDDATEPTAYFSESMESVNTHFRRATIVPHNYVQKSSLTNMVSVRVAGLEPHSRVVIEAHSDPVILGTYDIDKNGNLSVDIPVPANISAGFHTLHVIGKTFFGEAIDLWQIIEVRGAAGDIDEDGTQDDVDACIYISASGIDSDRDNIDDACDLLITDPPQGGTNEVVAVLPGKGVNKNRPTPIQGGAITATNREELKKIPYSANGTADSSEVLAYRSSKNDFVGKNASIAESMDVKNNFSINAYWIVGIITIILISYFSIKQYSKRNG